MMRAILRFSTTVLCLLLAGMGGAHAQGKTIDQLSPGAALAGSELIAMFQGANPAVTTTPAAIASYIAQSLTMTGKLTTAAPGAGGAQFNLPQGTAPTTPNNGDVWLTSTGLFYRANGATVGPIGGNGLSAGTTTMSGGSSGCVMFDTSGGLLGCDSKLTYAGNGGQLNLQPAANQNQPVLISGGSTTGSSTATFGYAVTGTVNTTGSVDGAAFFANITNTASGSGTKLADLQVGGVSTFSLDMSGNFLLGQGANATYFQTQFNAGRPGVLLRDSSGSNTFFSSFSGGSGGVEIRISNNPHFGWSPDPGNNAADTELVRSAAAVVGVTDGSGNAREFLARSYEVGGSAPTASGSCAVTSQVGGNTAGKFTASGACAGGAYTLTFGFTAANGWQCDAQDMTTPTDTVKQTASSTTSCTFTATTANSDVIAFKAMAY